MVHQLGGGSYLALSRPRRAIGPQRCPRVSVACIDEVLQGHVPPGGLRGPGTGVALAPNVETGMTGRCAGRVDRVNARSNGLCRQLTGSSAGAPWRCREPLQGRAFAMRLNRSGDNRPSSGDVRGGRRWPSPAPHNRARSGIQFFGPFPYRSWRTRRGARVTVGGCCLPFPIGMLAVVGLAGFVARKRRSTA